VRRSPLEEAFAVLRGAGERALLVAEELALHQGIGDGAAINRHERLVAARAVLVDQARRELLALPDSPEMYTGAWVRASLPISSRTWGERRAVAQQPLALGRRLGGIGQRQRRFHQGAQLLETDRLGT